MGRSTDLIQRNRSITVVVALATLTSNILSARLFHQLPDDPLHIPRNFGWYLHVANVLSVFGLLGALREHALSISIFSNYLIADTILCAIPRFLVLGILHSMSSDLCSPALSQSSAYPQTSSQSQIRTYISAGSSASPDLPYPQGQWDSISSGWSKQGCLNIITLAQWTLAAGVVAGTILQFVGALYVREFAHSLWKMEAREEQRAWRAMVASMVGGRTSTCLDAERGIGGLEVISEEDEFLSEMSEKF